MTEQNIVIYQAPNGKTQIDVQLQNDTIWLTQRAMADLFECSSDNISLHLRNIYNDAELEKDSTTEDFSVVQTEGAREVRRTQTFYNLDAIIAVGYRVNSKKATQFRIWATGVLKQYLVDGYAVNEKRLKEKQAQINKLQNAINLLSRSIKNYAHNVSEAEQLAQIMSDFALGLNLLDDYDNKTLDTKGKTKQKAVVIGREEFLSVIDKMKPEFGSDVFANPKDNSFDSSINQIYQTFDGKDCYPSLEEKAAMLLYFLVKNHSFTDGNKRIGAACFLYFLNKNGILYKDGLQIIDNATLFALTILIAESKPEEKDTMKQVIISILNKKA
jgi:prophage maintenance system killer protein